jgi:hypothetical protein
MRCERCGGAFTAGSWILKDGNYYHGSCLPMTSMLDTANHGTLANIARLTGQVASLTDALRKSDAQRDELHRMLTACEEERDAARVDLADTRAQLDKVRRDRDEMIKTFDEVEAQRDDASEEIARLHASMKLQRDATKQALDDRDAAHAKLGRAVAALQEARDGISAIYRHIDEDREIKAMKACKPITDKIDAILADADSKDAGEAWLELLAAYASHNQRGEDGPCAAQSIMDLQHELAEERVISHALVNDHHEVEAMLIAERAAAQAEAAAHLELIGDAALFLRPARRHLEGTAVEGTSWFDGLVHLVLVMEKAQREPSALAARVPLWRELEKWCLQMQGHAKSPHLDHVLAKLAALDEKDAQ